MLLKHIRQESPDIYLVLIIFRLCIEGKDLFDNVSLCIRYLKDNEKLLQFIPT